MNQSKTIDFLSTKLNLIAHFHVTDKLHIIIEITYQQTKKVGRKPTFSSI
jgi:hypothetical protein